jgi:hypothetical protein
MRLRTILSAFILFAATGVVSSAPGATTICEPQILADRTYGGTDIEYLNDFLPTADGGFIATGGNYHGGVADAGPSFGTFDVYAVRTDRSGAVVWQRFYGGTDEEQGQSVAAAGDGGFIIGGYSASGISGNKTSPQYGNVDYWIVRLGADGSLLWDKSFGGTGGDYLKAVIPMPAGGFLLAGESYSGVSGNKTSPRRDETMYSADLWIVRIDDTGNKLWEQSYGGTGEDHLGAVVATADGGIMLGSASSSTETGNKTAPQIGGSDYWVLRLDATGEIIWQRTYGGNDWDELRGITATSDGGFLLGGISYSPVTEGYKTTEPFGSADYWIVRIDANGEKIWETGFGGTDYDNLLSVASTADGGFLLGGASYSAPGGNKTSAWRGRSDLWIVRINSAGEKRWEESYGGLGDDYGGKAVQTSDGRFLLGGTSDNLTRGNKTAPPLGSLDFWMVELAPENPEDCDNDRVPDNIDQCLSTPPGDFVDVQGCGLSQLCPCSSPWPTPSNYVACVSSNSARLVAQGAMTEEQRQSVLNAAMTAYCPPPPQDVVVFGLTNRALGGATIEAAGEDSSHLYVNGTDPSGNDGASIRLGQADSGVFIYPYASISGSYDDRWYMRGSAFGRVNGVDDMPVSRMRARKPYYEVYPVEVDLSPLNPASVTWQVWSSNTLVLETNVPEAIAEFTVYSASTLGPRANPFWRMPDGSVGALIEFTEPVTENATIIGPFGEYSGADRIFARANSPSNVVDYVSRVDVVVGGGIYGYEVLDERPGVFRRGHRILGPGVLLPSIGRLQVTSQQTEEFVGVLIETPSERRLDVTFEPILLTNELSTLTLSLSGFFTDASDTVGALRFETTSNLISVSAFMLTSPSQGELEVRVYQAGVLQGQSHVTNSAQIGTFPVLSEPNTTKIIGIGGGVRAQDKVMFGSFAFDQVTSFQAVDGQTWRGDFFQVVGNSSTNLSNSLSALSVFTSKVPSFAITSEDSSGAPPSIAIALAGPELILTWPARNLPIILEASETLPGNFTRVAATPVYQTGQYRVTLPASSTGNRFFRLRTAD